MEIYNRHQICQGVSFGSAICEIDNLNELENCNYDIIEVPLSIDKRYSSVLLFAKERNMKVALHIPSREMVQVFPFILDTRTQSQVDLYIKYVSECLNQNLYREMIPSYIVVHYPLISKTEDVSLRIKLNSYFLNAISKCINNKSIPLFLENISVDPECIYGRDYKNVLSNVDGICFDIGHAHTANCFLNRQITADLVDEMFFELSDNIKCVHLYNTVCQECLEYSPKLHYPFGLIPNLEPEFMNESHIIECLMNLPELQYIIYEPHRIQAIKYGGFGRIGV